MKILFFRGEFSSNGKNFNEGLICFCHIDKDDTKQSVSEAIFCIQKRRKPGSNSGGKKLLEENVVLVPFSCLDEKNTTMYFSEARTLFKELVKGVTHSTATPFVSDNELMLHVSHVDSYVRFVKI